MSSQFDTIINRKNTNSLKYDFAVERGKKESILPLWVADMDFMVAPEIIEALEKTVSHGIYGYSDSKEDYFQALQNWFQKKHHYTVQKEWLIKTPGVVFAIAQAIRTFTKEGEYVLIQTPVYYPFREVIEVNQRKVATNSLILKDGHYEIDFEDFEKQVIEKKIKLFILCNPHNPVGRVWTKEELTKIGDICVRNHVLVISDEIHCDFTYPGYTHTVFSSICKEFEEISILCTSPSKTFNLAGLQILNIFVPNTKIKKQFERAIAQVGYSQVALPGIVACKAAYTYGEEWLAQVKQYIKKNLDFVREYLHEKLPDIQLIEPEGTYLIWLDFRGLGLSGAELHNLIENKAGLWLDEGDIFGTEGVGFERINIACPRKILEEALNRIYASILLQRKQVQFRKIGGHNLEFV